MKSRGLAGSVQMSPGAYVRVATGMDSGTVSANYRPKPAHVSNLHKI